MIADAGSDMILRSVAWLIGGATRYMSTREEVRCGCIKLSGHSGRDGAGEALTLYLFDGNGLYIIITLLCRRSLAPSVSAAAAATGRAWGQLSSADEGDEEEGECVVEYGNDGDAPPTLSPTSLGTSAVGGLPRQQSSLDPDPASSGVLGGSSSPSDATVNGTNTTPGSADAPTPTITPTSMAQGVTAIRRCGGRQGSSADDSAIGSAPKEINEAHGGRGDAISPSLIIC